MQFQWKKEYETGIAKIDEQHQRLFQIARETYMLLKDEYRVDKYDDIVALIEELKNYAVFHFQTEEEYMRSIDYKDYLPHKAEHDKFMEKINSVDYSQVDEEQDAYLLEMLEFVVSWISNHILKRDKMIAAGSS
jgi:hemerythrin